MSSLLDVGPASTGPGWSEAIGKLGFLPGPIGALANTVQAAGRQFAPLSIDQLLASRFGPTAAQNFQNPGQFGNAGTIEALANEFGPNDTPIGTPQVENPNFSWSIDTLLDNLIGRGTRLGNFEFDDLPGISDEPDWGALEQSLDAAMDEGGGSSASGDVGDSSSPGDPGGSDDAGNY